MSNDSGLKILENLIDEIYFDYCKIALGKSLFEEINSLKSVSNLNELLNAFALVENQMSQRKDLLKLLYSAKEYNIDSHDPSIIELKSKLFDMLMAIRECNKVNAAINSDTVDTLKNKNAELSKELAKVKDELEISRKSNELLKKNNDNLQSQVNDLQTTIRRIRPFPASIEDFIRY